MVKKRNNAERNGDIFASIQADEERAKKPLAKDFYTAHPDLCDKQFLVDIIFFPKEPYNAWGVQCAMYRGNIHVGSQMGEIFAGLVDILLVAKPALYMKYCDRFRTKFTIIHEVDSERPIEWKKTTWGYQIVYL